MAKHALNLSLKIVLFFAIMLIVAKYVHYDALVNEFISKYVTLAVAEKIGNIISGESYPEPYDLVRDNVNILLNVLISMPLLSAILTIFNIAIKKSKPTVHLKEWSSSTVRRLTKLFAFTIIFWALFRFLPWTNLFPDYQDISTFTVAAIIIFNLLITIFCYWFLARKFILKGVR